MNQTFDKWTEMTKKIQASFQAITELNLQAMQNFNVIKPEELVEKNLQLAVENGNKAVAYMQESLNILKKTLNSSKDENNS